MLITDLWHVPTGALAGGHPRRARHLDHRQPEGRAAGRCAMIAAWHGSTRASTTTSASGSRASRCSSSARAPLDADGHVNVSPKGPIGSLRVIDAARVAYLDAIGLRRRDARPRARERAHRRHAVRLRGAAADPAPARPRRVRWPASPRFAALLERFASRTRDPRGAPRDRRVEVTRVADSCGYRVPLMTYEGEREHLRCPPPSGCARRAGRRSCAPSRRRATRARSTACPRVPAGFGEPG